MSTKRTITGFAIEGLGLDSGSSDGVCLYASNLGPPAAGTTDYEWISALVEPPEGVQTSINPYTGDWQVSAFTFAVSASDRLAKMLFHRQVVPSGALTAVVASTGGTVRYDVAGLGGEVVWIGDEAILLGTFSTDRYTGSSRAHWGTQATAHATGAAVYEDATPYLEGRVVRLVEHDLATGDERVRWRGLVRDVSIDEAVVVVECEELLGALSRVQLNAAAPNLASQLVITRNGGARLEGYTPRVVRGGDTVFIQIGEALARLTDRGAQTYYGSASTPAFEGAQTFVPLESGAVESAYEVLVLESLDGLPAGETTHPIAIAYSLLTSTGSSTSNAYDVLADPWALGLDYIDATAFTDAISATPGLSIDQIYLGWGGEPVDVLAVIQEQLLRPFGYFLTITVDGLLGLGRLRLLTVVDEATLATNKARFYADGPLILDGALAAASTEVVAEVGGTPWSDPVRVQIRDGRISARRARLTDAREYRLDYATIDPARVRVTGRADSDLANAFVNLLQLGLDAVPRVRCRVPDDAVTSDLSDLDLGAVVQITSTGVVGGWLLDADGQRTSSTETATFAGMIVGRDWSILDHSYTLELLLLSYRVGAYVRLRAPSAQVSSWQASPPVVTLETGAGLTFGEGSAPGNVFEAGDEVQFYARDGTLQSTDVVVVAAPSTTALRLSAAPSTYTPQAGDIVRLADSKSFGNDALYSQTRRPYVYLAPADGTFEDVDGDDGQRDIFGTAVFGGA